MSNNLERILAILKAEADVIDEINKGVSFRYKSNQHLVLEYGQSFPKRVEPSPLVGEPRACFENCLKLLIAHPELNYCEGFAIDDDIAFAVSHAWLINDDFEIIDPTWIGDRFKNCAYFGIVFNTDFVFETAQHTKHYGILDTDYLNKHQLKREGFPAGALHPK